MEQDYIELFKMYLYEQQRSQNTIDCYSRDFRQLRGAASNYGDVGLQDLAQINLTHFSKVLKASGQSYLTINRKIASINTFCQFMFEKGHISEQLFIRPLKIRVQNQFKDLDDKEFWKIRIAIHKSGNKMHICIFELLYNTGVRVSELANIKVDDIEMSQRKGKLTVIGKGEVVREIPLNKEARKAISDYLCVRRNTSEFLLVGQRGELKRGAIDKILKKYGYTLKIEISAHLMRHTMGYQLAKINVPPYLAQKILGHANLATTGVYCNIYEAEIIKALDKI